ncbi:MAG: hypothetical protein HY097_05370, partial [Nitrospinae bacterium]|nr:hypothetical protein [Nitrospinota bacterium]
MISNRRKRLIDKAARWVVTAGGAAIIAWLAAIFIFIAIEVYPLFGKPKIGEVISFKIDGDFRPAAIGMDEYHESSYIIGEDGRVFFFSPKNPSTPPSPPLQRGGILSAPLEVGGLIRLVKLDASSKITSVYRSGDNSRLALGTSDGRVLSVKITYKINYDSNNKRIIEPEIEENNLIQITTEKLPIKLLAFTEKESDIAATVYTEDGRLLFYGRKTTETLLEGIKTEEFHADLSDQITNHKSEIQNPKSEIKITSLAIDGFLENLYAGAESGNIYHFDIRERSSPKLINTIKASSSPITALSFLLGDVSLVAGDGEGGINIWFRVRDDTAETGWRLKKIHTLKSQGKAVTSISPSVRGKGFLTASSDGTVSSHFATSEQTRFIIQHSSKPISMVSYAPKNDGILSIDTENILHYQTVNDPHPEISFKSLFGKVWYEGYEKEE